MLILRLSGPICSHLAYLDISGDFYKFWQVSAPFVQVFVIIFNIRWHVVSMDFQMICWLTVGPFWGPRMTLDFTTNLRGARFGPGGHVRSNLDFVLDAFWILSLVALDFPKCWPRAPRTRYNWRWHACFFDAFGTELATSDVTLQLTLTRLPLITRFPFFYQTGFEHGSFFGLIFGVSFWIDFAVLVLGQFLDWW